MYVCDNVIALTMDTGNCHLNPLGASGPVVFDLSMRRISLA